MNDYNQKIKIIDNTEISGNELDHFGFAYKPKKCSCGCQLEYAKVVVEVESCPECGRNYSNLDILSGGIKVGIILLGANIILKLLSN